MQVMVQVMRGGRKFDDLVARVRKTKTGNEQQPEQIMFEDVIRGTVP